MSFHGTAPITTKSPGRLYLLQIDTDHSTVIQESQILPLQITNNTIENGQYFIPISQARQDALPSTNQVGNHHQIIKDKFDAHYEVVNEDVDTKNSSMINNHYGNSSILQKIDPSTSKYEFQISIDCKEHASEKKNATIQSVAFKSWGDAGKRKYINEIQRNQKIVIQNYVHISDREVLPRAVAVLPRVLQLRARDVISPRRRLLAQSRFGPVRGVKRKISSPLEACKLVERASANYTPLFFVKDEYDRFVYIDVSDQDKSNWISLLPLGDQYTANLWLYEENHELYVITTDVVACRTPLKLGYSKTYAEDYGFLKPPTKDLNEWAKRYKQWWCCDCKKEMSSAVMFQRHMNVYHKDKVIARRKYRCCHCSMTFARLFTLRRHRHRYCTMKPRKSDNPPTTDLLPAVTTPCLNSTPNSEDNRIPSDESFQNYSNGLDFSTNLFDPDRISNLDMSGTLRAEEFNPYSFSYKDENLLGNELGFVNTCSNGSEASQPIIKEKASSQKKKVKPVLESCSYCKQVLVREKKRLHVRQCLARRLQCKCGKVFTNKKLLAEHVFTEHPDVAEDESKATPDDNDCPQDNQDTSTTEHPYKCDQCLITFKRRGMLVNHLWRVHKTVSTNVPLQKKVLHYPCSECPKIYRTAAKRDRHVNKHHPGVQVPRGQSFEGGVRTCEPAACPACPRQYNTRAKMLQHLRAAHPHVASPPGKGSLNRLQSTIVHNEGIPTEEPVDYSSSHERMF